MVYKIEQKTPKKKFDKLVDAANKKHQKTSLKEFSGLLKFEKDPLEIQKELRNEWE